MEFEACYGITGYILIVMNTNVNKYLFCSDCVQRFHHAL